MGGEVGLGSVTTTAAGVAAQFESCTQVNVGAGVWEGAGVGSGVAVQLPSSSHARVAVSVGGGGKAVKVAVMVAAQLVGSQVGVSTGPLGSTSNHAEALSPKGGAQVTQKTMIW